MPSGPFDFTGDHLALDFINTLRDRAGKVTDGLGSPGALLEWLRQARVADPAVLARLGVSPPDARLLLDEAVRLRRAILTVVTRFARRAPVTTIDLGPVNRVLAACPSTRSIEAREGAYAVHETFFPEGPRGVLAPVAAATAHLLAEGEARRVRQCAHPRCSLWFYDTSRNGSRRWCSMARCGNRAKVAAHHRRQRAAGP